MIYLKHDPGPCPVDDAPHHTCVAPGSSGGAIIAGAITPTTEIVVPTPSMPSAAPAVTDTTTSTPPTDSTTFTTSTYRRKRTSA